MRILSCKRLARVRLAASLFVALLPAGHPRAEILLDSPTLSTPTWLSPADVVSTDLDHDGRPDAIVSNGEAASLSLLYGAGDGTFDSRTDVALMGSPRALALGDLDRDGNEDLVCGYSVRAGSTFNHFVEVLYRDAGGTFARRDTLHADLVGYDFQIGDLNGDEVPDLILVGGAIDVFMGRRGGGFAEPVRLSPPGGALTSALCDLNGDGRLDLACTCNWTITILLGNGDGTLSLGESYPLAGENGPIAVGDVDADGSMDLVTSGGSRLFLRFNDGQARFGSPVAVLDAPASGLAFADLDRDGVADLLGTLHTTHELAWLRGSSGSFDPPVKIHTGKRPAALAVADLDGNGTPDVLVANRDSYTLSTIINNGDGTLGGGHRYGIGAAPWSISSGDADGDGNVDLITANGTAGTVSVLFGGSDGTFAPPTDLAVAAATMQARLGDLTGDGLDDLVALASSAWEMKVYLSLGDRTFAAPSTSPTGNYPRDVALIDLDLDGVLDVVVVNHFSETLTVRRGYGDGTFSPPYGFATPPYPTAITAADFDEDGLPDVAVSYSAAGVVVYHGGGNGFLGTVGTYPTSPYAVDLASGDLDGDGHRDLAVACNATNHLEVLLGNGNGSFRGPYVTGPGVLPAAVALGDIDDDGHLDAVVANEGSDSIALLRGAGDGGFVDRVDYGAGVTPLDLCLVDSNRDGRLDVVVANAGENSVCVLVNRLERTPVTVESFAAAAVAGGALLSWGLTDADDVLQVVVQRAPTAIGPWVDLAKLPPARTMRFEDAGVDWGVVVWYRLEVQGVTGNRALSGAVALRWNEVSPATSRLEVPRMADDGRVRFTYSLADPTSSARLAVYDVRGRVVWAEVVPGATGEHVHYWSRSDHSGRYVAGGIYFVQLSDGQPISTRKFSLSPR